jgi:DNA-directed RNA polymerase specialized sigma24 family protein
VSSPEPWFVSSPRSIKPATDGAVLHGQWSALHAGKALPTAPASIQSEGAAQRTSLVLCELDGPSYEQIVVAMNTTVPAVTSLLVPARVRLRKPAGARQSGAQHERP